MKTLKIVTLGVSALFFVTSCGVKDRSDDIKTLNKKSEWNEEQTNMAIDFYIEGVDEACKRFEDAFLVFEKQDLEYAINRYGDEDVVKERRKEIKEAEKEFKRVRKEVDKKYKDSSNSYDDYDYEESENYDEYDY